MTEKATFAAGCFWGVEHEFRRVHGVSAAVSGYTGGMTPNPTYGDVCSDTTGHAEAVEVTFDPAQVSYRELADRFFKMHNPTTPNRQGPDRGSQYRSAIFTHSPQQAADAEAAREQAQRDNQSPIVTQIVPATTFFPAEAYHQRYFEKQAL